MSRNKWFVTALLFLILFLLTGCGADSADGNGDEEIRLYDSNNGDTVNLRIGQIVVITLESNPTTGYTWEVEELDESILAQVGDIDFIPESESESEPQLVGQGGTQVIHFQALAAGEFTLKLVYHQPWEGGDASPESFSVKIIVSE